MPSFELEQHLGRLFALADFGVIDAPAIVQTRRIVHESARVLGCAYAEIARDGEVIAIPVDDAPHEGRMALGHRAKHSTRPLVIFDTLDDEIGSAPAVEHFKLRSLVFWPLQANGTNVVLTLGWTSPRRDGLSDDETKMIDFLASLVSKLLVASERERSLAQRVDVDELTGLYNRSATLDHLAQALSAASRNNGKAAVLYVDLDRFKEVNDTFGHAAGDSALAEIARRMRTVLRKHEVAGRLGGDEFAIVVSAYASEQELEGLALRVLRALSAPIVHKGTIIRASASIGIATAPKDASTVEDLLACADSAMYAAKHASKSYSFYHAKRHIGMGSGSDDTPSYQTHLVFCMQPIVDARTNRPVGGEVLPRWLHPHDGLVLPGAFLNSEIEEEELHGFERFVVTSAIRRFAMFSQEHGALQLYVNIWNPHDGLLDTAVTTPASICLEFPENRVAAQPERYIEFIAACRERGFRVGLSDFTGDLPLRTLAQLDCDFVKIHARQFRDNHWNARTAKALRTVVDHAHRMSCTVIAEAVETPSEIELLVSSGVDALQGYAVCSPLTERDFSNWLLYRAAVS